MLQCIGMQNFIKISMRFKSYKCFHYKSSTGQNDARQSLVTVLHGNGWTILKYISIQNFKQIYHGVQELWAFSLQELDRPKWCSAKPRHRFAWQWMDNVKVHYTKFEVNMLRGSRVMSIFTNWSQIFTDAQQSPVYQKRLLCMAVDR